MLLYVIIFRKDLSGKRVSCTNIIIKTIYLDKKDLFLKKCIFSKISSISCFYKMSEKVRTTRSKYR